MGAKPTILVVEDDALLRMHAAGLLEDNGFSVVEAKNADDALKLLETRDNVRLLFTDAFERGKIRLGPAGIVAAMASMTSGGR